MKYNNTQLLVGILLEFITCPCSDFLSVELVTSVYVFITYLARSSYFCQCPCYLALFVTLLYARYLAQDYQVATYSISVSIQILRQFLYITYTYIYLLQDGSTPLSIAAEKGQVEVVELLLSNGADVDKKINVSSDMGLTQFN